MSATLLQVDVALGARSYPIRIGAGLLDDPAHWLDAIAGRHVLLVSDSNVAPLYAQRVEAGLRAQAAATLVLPAGEAHKTLDSAARVFDALATLKANRDATVLALGGGVVGDLAGFAAACWMRGVACVQMPTTLLAMVDSSVGGKTGVDLAHGKNLVGAFHQPRAVIADTATLATLPQRELRAALAEIAKYGALGDARFFAWLEANLDAVLARDAHALRDAIAHCCRQKAAIVARDETEQGERALLNFGHTFGHAIETVAGYGTLLHGEAVSIGMCLAAQLATRLDMADGAEAQRLRTLLARCGLPTRLPALDPDRLLAAMQLDKKNASGRLRLVLWDGIGRARVVDGVDPAQLRATLASAG